MHRYFVIPGLALLLLCIMGSTWTGLSEKFKYGNVQLGTVTSFVTDADAGYCAIQIKDANADGDLDAGDGLFLIDDDGNEYGPYLYSGGAAPTDAQYWVGAANGTLSAEHNLGAFTGVVYNAAGTPSAVTFGTNGIDLDTSTINFDPSEVGSVTWGTAATWTFPTSISFISPFMALGNGTTNEARWRFLEDEDNGTNYCLVAAPLAIGANPTFRLPAVDITMPTALPAATYLLQLSSAGAMTTVGSVFTDNHPVRADGVGNLQDVANWTYADTTGASVFSGAVAPVAYPLSIDNTSNSASASAAHLVASGNDIGFGVIAESGLNNAASSAGVWGIGNSTTEAVYGVVGSEASSHRSAYSIYAAQETYAGNFIDLAEQAAIPTAVSGKGTIAQVNDGRLAHLEEDAVTKYLVGNVYSSTADSAAVNTTTTLTDFDTSYSLPANSLAVGRVLRVTAGGTLGYDAATPPAAVFLYVRIGNATLIQVGSFAPSPAGSGNWGITCNATVRTVGATGTILPMYGSAYIFDGTLNTTLGTRTSGEATIDTTGALDVEVAVWMTSNADADNTFTCTGVTVDLV